MSRSGYTEDCDNEWAAIRWRGQVASAIRGKRGQAFLRELMEALDAMPEKRLIAGEYWNGEACALGVLGAKRGIDPITVDPDDYARLARMFGVAYQLIQEIEYENDDAVPYWIAESPETRWRRMRHWVDIHLIEWDPPAPRTKR